MPQVEICANCEGRIGKLEQAYLHNGNVICKTCDQRINAGPPVAVHRIESHAPAPAAAAERIETDAIVTHPAMFWNRPVLFLLCVVLCFFGIGFLILGIWWLHCRCTSLSITNRRSTLRTGILAKHTTEVRHSDIRNLSVRQNFLQRLFGVGTIGISSAGQADIEIIVSGIPSPQKIAGVIRKYQG